MRRCRSLPFRWKQRLATSRPQLSAFGEFFREFFSLCYSGQIIIAVILFIITPWWGKCIGKKLLLLSVIFNVHVISIIATYLKFIEENHEPIECCCFWSKWKSFYYAWWKQAWFRKIRKIGTDFDRENLNWSTILCVLSVNFIHI